MNTESHWPISPVVKIRDWKHAIAGVTLATIAAFIAAAFLLYVDVVSLNSWKVLAGALGGVICLLAMYLSGNPRLFCLWGYMLTLPFDLSKRFGVIFKKMGGESSLRVEMSDLFLLGLVAFLAWEVWTGRRRGLRIPKVTFLWILIMLLGGLAIALGPWRTTAAHEIVRMTKMTILFVVIVNELDGPRKVLQCASGLTLGLFLQAIIGMIQYVAHKPLGMEMMGEPAADTLQQLSVDSVLGENTFRVGGFLSHPNVFGIFLAALLPLAIGLFLLRVGKGYKLFFLFSVVLGMTALVATLSRSGWVSFTAGFILLMGLMIFHQGLRRRSLLAAVSATMALAIVCMIFAGRIASRIFDSQEIAMIARTEYKRDALAMIAAKPLLGFGLNSYVLAVPQYTRYGAIKTWLLYRSWIPPVHNIFLLWWAETGIIGLLFHVALLGSLIWIGLGNLKVRNELLFTVNAACLSALLAFLIDGFFSFSLRFNQIQRLFWVQAGMMMAVHYWRLRHPAGAEP